MKRYTKGTLATGVKSDIFSQDWELKGFATVEVRDRDRDLIRVKGFRGELHRESPVKIVGTTHRYGPKEDGHLPVVAVVGEFVPTVRKVKGIEVPALAFGANYARNESGDAVDAYANKFKAKYDRRELDAFSIGLEAYKAKPFRDGGMEIVDWDAFEISCCLVPRNPYSTAITQLKADFGDDFDPEVYLEEQLIEIRKSLDAIARVGDEQHTLNKILGRLDDIESAITALVIPPEAPAGAGDDRTNPPGADRLSEIAKALDGLRSALTVG